MADANYAPRASQGSLAPDPRVAEISPCHCALPLAALAVGSGASRSIVCERCVAACYFRDCTGPWQHTLIRQQATSRRRRILSCGWSIVSPWMDGSSVWLQAYLWRGAELLTVGQHPQPPESSIHPAVQLDQWIKRSGDQTSSRVMETPKPIGEVGARRRGCCLPRY